MLKKNYGLYSLLLLLSFVPLPLKAQTQTWIKVGGANNTWTTSVAATVRFGYPDSVGTNWVTVQEPVGSFTQNGGGSQIPSTVAALANPSNLPLEVDVLQSGTPFVVTEGDVWGGTGCETTVTFTIPATGAATLSQTSCGTSGVVTTGAPPATTPPPPVVTPPPPTVTPVPPAPVTNTCPVATQTGAWFKVSGTNATLVIGLPACTIYRYGHTGSWTANGTLFVDKVFVPTDNQFNWTGPTGSSNELDIMETGVTQLVTATLASGQVVVVSVPVAPGLTAPTTVVPINVVTTSSTSTALSPTMSTNAMGDLIIRYPSGYSLPLNSCVLVPADGPTSAGAFVMVCANMPGLGQSVQGTITINAPTPVPPTTGP